MFDFEPPIPQHYKRLDWHQRRTRLCWLINALFLVAYYDIIQEHDPWGFLVFPFVAFIYNLVEWCDRDDNPFRRTYI